MAKQDYTYSFKNAYIDIENNTITEVTKDASYTHNLESVLKELEGKQLSITFKETNEIFPEGQ